MTDFEFYQVTKDMLEKMIDLRGITHSQLELYYSHTDQYCDFYKDLSGIPRIFAQMIFHMQNATMISNIVKFEKNYSFLKKVTCRFVPKDFLDRYSGNPDRVEALVNDLRWNSATKVGLKWNSSENKSGKQDVMATRLAQSMFECAEFLIEFKTSADVLEDFKEHATDSKALIKYFNSKIRTGFSVALTCDFLKEFDTYFEFLPKPDVHIKDVIGALKKKTYKHDIDVVEEMQQITHNINLELTRKGEPQITVYQLDRMIWLVCTDNFFIKGHNNGSIKKLYISKL